MQFPEIQHPGDMEAVMSCVVIIMMLMRKRFPALGMSVQ